MLAPAEAEVILQCHTLPLPEATFRAHAEEVLPDPTGVLGGDPSDTASRRRRVGLDERALTHEFKEEEGVWKVGAGGGAGALPDNSASARRQDFSCPFWVLIKIPT